MGRIYKPIYALAQGEKCQPGGNGRTIFHLTFGFSFDKWIFLPAVSHCQSQHQLGRAMAARVICFALEAL